MAKTTSKTAFRDNPSNSTLEIFYWFNGTIDSSEGYAIYLRYFGYDAGATKYLEINNQTIIQDGIIQVD